MQENSAGPALDTAKAVFRSMGSAGVVWGAVFGAVSWILSSDQDTLSGLSQTVDNHFLFFQFGLPTILGLLVGITNLAVRYHNRMAEDRALLDQGVFPSQQVESLKWELLSEHEQSNLVDRFGHLDPKPTGRLTSLPPALPEFQKELQMAEPVRLDIADRLASEFQIPELSLQIPLEKHHADRVEVTRRKIVEQLDAYRAFTVPESLKEVLKDLYDFLPCTDREPSADERKTIDCVIASGTRWSMPLRVDEALRQHNLSGSEIIFTGNRPSYDDGSQPPVAEAQVMHHHLLSKDRTVPADLIHLEPRSRSSYESLQLVRPTLAKMSTVRDRPINVGLITSSYHMRRLLLQFLRIYRDYSFVDRTYCLTVPASVDFGRIVASTAPLEGQELTTLQMVISEYFKLVGGRIAGEL